MTSVDSLSIIIPTLNEGQTIGSLLNQLREQEGINLDIILVDGGSMDATLDLAREQSAGFSQSRVLQTDPGRGRQMNAGADMANHSWLLFLHCDSLFTSPVQLRDSLASLKSSADAGGKPVAGHFTLAFQTQDPVLKNRLGYFETKTSLNRPGTFNGDQGLMISRQAFWQAGGFPDELPFLEDQLFAEQFRQVGNFITLPFTLGTSARRFEEEGYARRLLLNAIIMGMFHLRTEGISANHFFSRAREVYPPPAHQSADTPTANKSPAANASPDTNIPPAANPSPDLRSVKTSAWQQGTFRFQNLARQSVFAQGWGQALKNIYSLGRYVTQNGWQLFLLAGGKKALRHWDRLAAPLLCNPLGYLTSSLIIAAWLLLIWLRSL